MSAVQNLSRRRFLKASALAAGGLVLGVWVPALERRTLAQAPAGAPFAPNAFVRIGTDESVTVIINHSEMGQGTFTGLSMLVAEELDADWSKVRAEHAPVHADYNHVGFGIQMVGGSTSTWTEWERLRRAGATARAMLIEAAAEGWSVAPATCATDGGHVVHAASGRRASFGQLAAAAARRTPPADVPLKDPKDFKLIGKATQRLDTPAKVNGAAVFGLDVQRPGMLVAMVARPPVFGGKLKSFDASRALAVPGVRHVIAIDRGVAVVADGYHAARLGRRALEAAWDDGPLAALDSAAQRRQYAELARQPGAVARKQGDAVGALAGAARTIEAVYELPYLAHAPMEPLNCVADVRPDGCDVWTGTQFQTAEHQVATRITGLAPEKVRIHTPFLGGGFGRRAVGDCHFVAEAVEISRAIRAPVKVIWTREDDIRGGYYRPASYHTIAATLGADGKPAAWRHRVVCQSFAVGTPFEPFIVKDGVDSTAVEGAADHPYEVPNLLVDWSAAPAGVPVLWWRSVGHSHNAFVVESFIDELAHAAGKDPLEYRRGLLAAHPRHLRLLGLLAEKAAWAAPARAGRGRGLAIHESFGSLVAQTAEVSVSREGNVRVHRVVCAIDCGPTVNPDSIRAQMESGIVFGLSAALFGEITFENGRVRQRNFHDYPVLRMNEMPEVETHIVPSTETMGGVGETGVPPIAPAVANAIFAATGKRARRLPLRPDDVKES